MTSNDEETKLSFLLSGSCDLPSSYIKLRSYLNIHLANVADECNIKLLKSFRNRNKTCPNCYTPWSASTATFKLLPAKKFIPQFKGDETVKEIRNTLVLKCKVCTKKSKFSLVKKKYVEKKVKKEVTESKNRAPSLEVNSKNMSYQSPGMLVKKKKKVGDSQETNKFPQNKQHKSPQGSKTTLSDHTKKLVPNPFAVQRQNQCSKKKDKKFERLKLAVKQEQSTAKKTLQDFLSLV